MSAGIFFLVLLSAALHATWNMLSKQGRPAIAFFFLMSFYNTILWSWTLLTVHPQWDKINPLFFTTFLLSIVAECLYCGGIAYAYRKVDMSQGYPMIRSLPVLMVAILTFLLPPHRYPGWLGGAGLLLVCLGCLLMPLRSLREFRLSRYREPAIKYILIAAVGTTGYTLCDAFSVNCLNTANTSGLLNACFYLFLIEFGIAVSLGSLVLFSKPERMELLLTLKHRPWQPAAAGMASSSAYILILFCMQYVTQLSFLQAFRQMSLPFGVLLGIWVLKEKVSTIRWAGVMLIVSGLILIALQ